MQLLAPLVLLGAVDELLAVDWNGTNCQLRVMIKY